MHILGTSREYVFIPIDAPKRIGDPTQYPPQACLIPWTPDEDREPGDSDWVPATWIGGEVALLVGPQGTIAYAPGEYMAFATLTAGIERPVMKSGRVRIGPT